MMFSLMPSYASAGGRVRAAPIASIDRGGIAVFSLGQYGSYTLPANWSLSAQIGGYLVCTNAFNASGIAPPHVVVYRSAADFASTYTPE
jgi:hypothetical protein